MLRRPATRDEMRRQPPVPMLRAVARSIEEANQRVKAACVRLALGSQQSSVPYRTGDLTAPVGVWNTRLAMKHRWSFGPVTALPLLAVLLLVTSTAACGQTRPGSSNTTAVPTTTAPPLPGGYGLLPSDPHLSDRILIATNRSKPGLSIDGTLVVVNDGAAPINLTKSCRPDFVVALTNSHYTPQVAFAAVCRSTPLMIAPGSNRLPVRVMTTYLGCGSSGSHSAEPACLADGGPPPLPMGEYDAVLIGSGLALPEPEPVAIRLTPGPH